MAIAEGTTRGPDNNVLIHFSPLQDWSLRSNYILNSLKARRRKVLYEPAIEVQQGDVAPLREQWLNASQRVASPVSLSRQVAVLALSEMPVVQPDRSPDKNGNDIPDKALDRIRICR